MDVIEREPSYLITADATYLDDRTHVLNHSGTFGLLSRGGDILPYGREIQGLYYQDTRYINQLELKINGLRPLLLSSNMTEKNEILSVDLTNPEMPSNDGGILHHGTVHLRRSQFVRDGLYHEKIDIENFNSQPQVVNISLTFGGDFKDIFEVRGMKREKRGLLKGYEYPDNRTIIIAYEGLDGLFRKAHIIFAQDIPEIKNQKKGELLFPLTLHHRELITLDYSISLQEGEARIDRRGYYEARMMLEPDLEKAKEYFPIIETSNEQFTHWINRSKADLVSLMSDTPYGKYPFAGVPWYNTAFGRDGIITALETLWVAPNLARDVLLFLAANQADQLDDANDAEPGKILHETRGGEMVALNEVPFKRYYGTIDATPLFVILAGEYYNRTGDNNTLKRIWPAIIKAVDWANTYGDIDGDGFIEYKHKAKNGLTNQGWKDSHDSIFHNNGQLAEPPIALCEVQAYAYSAKIHAAHLATVLEEKKRSEQWRNEAKVLKEKFNEVFWDKELDCYVLALDGNKRPCRVKSSNAGQVLFTGIADPKKAEKLVRTLMRSDLFNGWGVRTLSSEEIRYNPMSYHNGSVWPHDVALIADGMARYGYHHEALRLMTGMFDASLFIHLQRLPELFCGTDRRKGEGPTAYPVACSPQAWSVGAVFMFLKAILQVKISPMKKVISFHKPILPSYLENIKIRSLSLGDDVVDLEVMRYGGGHVVGVNWNITSTEWELNVVK